MRLIKEYSIEKEPPAWLPWLVCMSASLFFFYEFIQGNMFASIADNIMHDFHVQADKMAYLSSIYYASNVIFLFVAGMVLDRFSTKNTMLFAMCLCVISTFLLAHAHSFYLALFCRFLTGIGSAFCLLGPIRFASQWFPPSRMALVTGIIVTVGMSGGMVAQYPLTKLVSQLGWRDALIQVGWLGLGILMMMAVGIVDKTQAPEEKSAEKIPVWVAARKAYLNRQSLRAGLYTSLMNMAIAVFGAMMGALYLIQKMGVSKVEASAINAMLFLGAILGGPLIGWFSDKLGLRVLPMKVGAVASLITLMIILLVPVSLPAMKILFFLLGFFTSAQVISYAFVAESTPPVITATAVSLVSILTQGGYIIYQNLFSLLLINHGGMQLINDIPVYSLGDYQFAATILPIGLILAWMTVFKLKETYCQQVEE